MKDMFVITNSTVSLNATITPAKKERKKGEEREKHGKGKYAKRVSTERV